MADESECARHVVLCNYFNPKWSLQKGARPTNRDVGLLHRTLQRCCLKTRELNVALAIAGLGPKLGMEIETEDRL
jgi:hypothetical protein